ncbi:hypothetical protein P3L10_028376 [Capsicum annuum]
MSCIAYFLKLLEDQTLYFQMSMVYGLLKCRIKYAGDDKDLKEGEKKIDEIWINYCSMLIFFGLKEFSIVTGLRCDRPEKPLIKETPTKGPINARKKYGLLGIVGSSYKEGDLIANLEDKAIPNQYREKLCLVWFVHFVILARDVRKVKEDDLLMLADDFEKFHDYPKGYDNYYLTVKYLLTKLTTRMITLLEFLWAFMAWAFKVIPPLQKQFKDYPNEVSHPRTLRRLAAKSSKKLRRWVVHSWIMPTKQELGRTFFITLSLVDTTADPTPNVKALHNQPTGTDSGVSSGGAAAGVVDDGGSHPATAVATSHDYEHIGALEKINTFENTHCTGPSHPSSLSYSHYKCKVCKEREDKLLKKLEAIAEAIEELKSKRGVMSSKKVREPYTPTVAVRRKRRNINQILSILKIKKLQLIPLQELLKFRGH